MKKLIIICSLSAVLLSCKSDSKSTDNIQETPPSDALSTEVNLKDTLSSEVEVPKEKSIKALKAELDARGYKTFDYEDPETKDTILMQQYFIAFLKVGPIRGQNEEEAEDLQKAHLAHLKKMYDLGYADISGPFGDDGAIRGVTIYNVPTKKMADSLANADPMVKAGRLEIEIHPWWAAKGYSLR
ncbi:YciI family protein [Gaetbulibacter sp. M240]|uniref:YciI family protein n=1 Tax=Gaetbulibacter sp. M240 TaxID=3126511 RepID=UPI00374E841D